MANHTYQAVLAVHATLTATGVDTVTLTGGGEQIWVTNRTGTNPLFLSFNTVTPVATKNTFYLVPGVAGATRQYDLRQVKAGKVIKLTSKGAMAYSVEIL